MKILLFSDNHRDKVSVKEMIKQNPNIERIISLGDSEMKEHELTELNIFGVKGNYPFEPNFPKQMILSFNDVKILLTHGHLFSVKLGLSKLLNYASYNDINIVCFGHTHNAYLKEHNNIIFINPGALSKSRMFSQNSYAILDIKDTSIEIIIKTLSNEILFKYKKQR